MRRIVLRVARATWRLGPVLVMASAIELGATFVAVAADAVPPPTEGGPPRVRFTTTLGAFVVELDAARFPDDSPLDPVLIHSAALVDAPAVTGTVPAQP